MSYLSCNIKRHVTNMISHAMADYREDFRENREWWKKMGVGNNNEYLFIRFKNGDIIVVQSDYFDDGHNSLPRFRADEVMYVSRYYGEGVETTTTKDMVVDTDTIVLYKDCKEISRYVMSEAEMKEIRRLIWELDADIDATLWMLNYCRNLASGNQSIPNEENIN